MKKFARAKSEFEAWVNEIIANLNYKAGDWAYFSTDQLTALDWKIIEEIYDCHRGQLLKGRTRAFDILWEDSYYEVELVILEAHQVDVLDFLHWELINYYLNGD